MPGYDDAYHANMASYAHRSAEVIVPLLMDIVRPRSVIDVGCGTGSWLSVFRDRGVERITGLDGPWVSLDRLRIPPESFIATDLAQPLPIAQSFDLVVSLEVAEHLPPSAASQFVDSLVALGPVVFFSAAIPWQSGERHLNTQWPAWWAAHFRRHGYQPIDCIRRAVWNDPHVEWWYAQNAVIYARPGAVTVTPDLARDCLAPGEAPLALIHPRCYLNEIRPWQRRVMDRLLRLPLRIASPRLRHRARLLAGRMLSPRAS